MSILSSAWGGIKSAASSVASLFGGGSSQSAAAFQAPLLPGTTIQGGKVVQNQTPLPTMSTAYGPAASTGNGAAVLNNKGQVSGILGGSGGYTPLPSPIYQQPTSILGGQSITSGGPVTTGSPSRATSFSSAPVSLLGGTSMAGASTSGRVNSSITAPATPMNLPPKPTYADVGKINNSHLIPALGKDYGYNPDTGQFEANVDAVDPVQARQEAMIKNLDKNIPKEDSAYEDPAVVAAQTEVDRRREEVKNYTAQLNSIVAKQNQDLLQVRGTDSREGVTEAVYGGQSAEINREAAIRALPVQAQIAAAQGNQQLAQDYLTQLVTFTKDKLDKEFEHRQNVFSAAASVADKSEKKVIESMNEKLKDQKKTADNNLKTLNQYILKASNGGQRDAIGRLSALAESVGDPNFTQYLGNILASTPGIANSSPKPTPSTAGVTLTPAKVNTGAAKAGIAVDEFKNLHPDVQNYFANAPADKLKGANDAITNVANGSESADDVKKEIDASSNPQAVKDYLKGQVDAVVPQESSDGGGFWSKIVNLFN